MPENSFIIKEQTPAEKALITSALNLFIGHHEKTISVTQLLRVTGVSKAVFYQYFANKDDICAAILLTDEMALTALLKELRLYGSIPDLLQQYLKFRIQQVEKYRVLVRLEKELLQKNSTLLRFQQWQWLRREHVNEFTAIVEAKLARSKKMDNQNIRFYYGLVWALANGMANLSESDFFHELIEDRRGFTRFLLQSIADVAEVRG